MASVRLLDALRDQGVDARMIVKTSGGDERPWISAIGGGWRARKAFLAERLRIFMHNGLSRKNLFKVSLGDTGLTLHDHPWIADADVIVLNWFNQGMMSLDELLTLASLGKPVVWVMHDMWPMTGICHHAGQCRRFTVRCGACPLLHSHRRSDLSTIVFNNKSSVYDDSAITFVAVSRWLQEMASISALTGGRTVTAINNAFPVNDYSIYPRSSRSDLGLPDDGSRLVVICAARLDDSVKGLPAAVEALNMYSGPCPITAVLCGDIRSRKILDGLKVPYVLTGPVCDPQRLADIYAHSSVVLSSSSYETLGYTLIEGMAAGAVPVALGGDGRDDVMTHLVSGYLARKGDTADLAAGIDWALSDGPSRERLHAEAARRFDSAVIARRYIICSTIYCNLTNEEENHLGHEPAVG